MALEAKAHFIPPIDAALLRPLHAPGNFAFDTTKENIDRFNEFLNNVPPEYAWDFLTAEAFREMAESIRNKAPDADAEREVYRLYWNDMLGQIEAFSVMSAWRLGEITRSAVWALNRKDAICAAVMSRASLETAAAYAWLQTEIRPALEQVATADIPNLIKYEDQGTLKGLEDKLLKVIYASKLKDVEAFYNPTNIVTIIGNIAKKIPHQQVMADTYYLLCEVAHPNWAGRSIYITKTRPGPISGQEYRTISSTHGADAGVKWPEPKNQFDFMLSNPPFGVTWGGKDGYETEARKLETTRYKAGMPRTNDGALLFLQTMLAKMKPADKGGSRIAIIFSGSPLSNGDCGSGESEIRRWILENDWLDAIVMLPDQLFYNTGIYTYVWLLRNSKPKSHRDRVMIIDARKQFEKEPKSFGDKRNRITQTHRVWIEERYNNGWNKAYPEDEVRIFKSRDFAYHKVNVVFWQTDENDKPAIITEPYEKAFTPANLAREQEFHDSDLTFRIRVNTNDGEKTETLELGPKDSANKKLKTLFPKRPEIVSVEWTHRDYVKDDEYVPYGEDIEAFLKREISKPIIRWEDSTQLGYEMLPNKYFHKYQPPTPANQLLDEFWRLENEAETMLKRLAV